MIDQRDVSILSNLVKKTISTERNRFVRKLKRNEFESDEHQQWYESHIEYLMGLYERLQAIGCELEEEEFARKEALP